MREDGKCMKCLRVVKKVLMFLVSHIGLVSLVVGYCIVGAFTFEQLEREWEKAKKDQMKRTREKVAEDLWNMTNVEMDVLSEHNWTAQAEAKLRQFEISLVEAIRRDGWDGSEDPAKMQWTFSGALFYSIIVITTIGYGHIAPKTAWGKVVTIFYAILGIPLMLICLSKIGDAMAESFKFLYWRVCCYMCEKKPKKKQQRLRGRSFRTQRSFHGRGASIRRGMRHSARSANGLEMSRSMTPHEPPFRGCYDDMDLDLGHRARNQEGKTASKRSTSSDPPRGERRGNRLPVPTPIELEEAADVNGERVPVISNQYATSTDRDLDRVAKYEGTSKQKNMRREEELEDNPAEVEAEFYEDYDPDYLEDQPHRSVPIWLCIFLVVGYIFGGAFLFSGWEEWKFLDSAYFCFITLTTIGFGDFVPAQNIREGEDVNISIAFCSIYLLFGIALLAMSFNLVQEEVISSVRDIGKSLGIIKDEEDDEY